MKEAFFCPEKNEWMKAMESENDSLHSNKIWDVAELPSGWKVSGCSNENILTGTWKNRKLRKLLDVREMIEEVWQQVIKIVSVITQVSTCENFW